MPNKIILSNILCILLLLPFCSRLKYDVTPHKTAVYHSLRVKVNAKNTGTNQKQNFKILLKYDDSRDKMFFLSPLNQVYGLLLLEGEKALLVNTKKKKYWKGRFNHLLQEIWGLDFDYREFKQLIVNGVVPGDKIKEQGIKISFERGPTNTNQENPQRMKIISADLLLKIKISNRKTGKGVISFSRNLAGMKKTNIRELLEAEDE
ncbi:MAG: hypothetical protein JSV88_27875 [Candidatus Aminicenantes bacterium]|nr:MAG: hypothetical protein JSV88_27875 [Candidatus Aminicenantes bacterium]